MSELKRVERDGNKYRFGASFPSHIITEIDRVRGDTPRSWWLYRLAIKELERQKNLKGGAAAEEQ
jgi:hypothetical protein